MRSVFRVLYPLYQDFQLVRYLPQGKFSRDSNRYFVTVFRRLIHRMGRDGVGLGPRYLTWVDRVVGRVEIAPFGVSEGRVALGLGAFCSGYFLPIGVTGRSILPPKAGSDKGRCRLVIQLRSNFCRLEGVFYLFTYFVGEGTRQYRTVGIRRRVVRRVLRLPVRVASRGVSREGAILSSRQVVKRRHVWAIFQGVFRAFRFRLYVRGLGADPRGVSSRFVFQVTRGGVWFFLVCGSLRVKSSGL